ncbi:DUF5906 domain-containing protein [Methylobacter sp. BlB1]|uniref:DUF5906 domain-containing protein n=1 Tax=Methylobacter sp. BlB1 TaxID=2785914 RepID=UPI0018943DC6|nr:DUF5906 domain-containing protein [Methylobacter sp. BlB1]MBF6649526.1 hypothetical protein [Methylobacter sp. BlB1]
MTSTLEAMRDELTADSRPKWEIELDAHIEKWNKTHASVMIGGKHKIMRFIPANATPTGRDSYEFISRYELNLVYTNTAIKAGEKQLKSGVKDIFKTHVMAWAEDYRSRSYTGGVVFLPAKNPPRNYYNTWQGFAVGPAQNPTLIKRILKHMKKIVCAGDRAMYKYLIKWIAYTVQNPDKPAGAAIVLRGNKGSGKGTLGRFLCNIWGNHSAHIANAKHLVGSFNGHLTDVCFMFADEAFYSGDKQGESVLKALITEPTLMIERKGIDAIQQPNYLKVLMATNSNHAVPASKDERRYAVYDVSDAYIGNREYFDALNKDVSDKAVQSAFLDFILNIDLSGWHTGDIPDSAGLREQRYYSMDTVQKWIVQSLIDGTFGYAYDETLEKPVDGRGWLTELTTKDLYAKYIEFCNTAKTSEYRILTERQVASYLGKVFKSLKRVGKRGRGIGFGRFEDAKAKFEQYEKVNLDELMSESPE